jgi:hypothetical protein
MGHPAARSAGARGVPLSSSNNADGKGAREVAAQVGKGRPGGAPERVRLGVQPRHPAQPRSNV